MAHVQPRNPADPKDPAERRRARKSPRWHDGRLWFSDWGAHEVVAVDLEGEREVVDGMPTAPFSLDWLPDGRLLVVSASEALAAAPGARRLARDPRRPERPRRDTPWNEIVVDGRGNAYVNSIGFDLMAGEAFAPGIIALVTPGRRRPGTWPTASRSPTAWPSPPTTRR